MTSGLKCAKTAAKVGRFHNVCTTNRQFAIPSKSPYLRRQYFSSLLGYMAIDPSLTKKAGDGDASKLFDTQIGLRYGCSILRLFIDEEGGNLFLALGRWAGQRGKPEFPNRVLDAWKQWVLEPSPSQATR